MATAWSIGHPRSVTDKAKKLLKETIDRLEESDEADVEQAWIDEVQKRARELETGQVQGLTWAEARRIMLGT